MVFSWSLDKCNFRVAYLGRYCNLRIADPSPAIDLPSPRSRRCGRLGGVRPRKGWTMAPDDVLVLYPDFAVLEAMWGDGFMSPGGADEVGRIVGDADLTGARVLD